MAANLVKYRYASLAALMLGVLSACAPVPPPPAGQNRPETGAPLPLPQVAPTQRSPNVAARQFVTVINRMEPAIERECLQRRSRQISCDFQFIVDTNLRSEPNAFQTVDRSGRPVIGFTASLIAATLNQDEIAFVVGHEASHHILNHLDQKSGAATAGAILLGIGAAAMGGGSDTIQTAQQIGASVGANVYSKEWELQADYLGAIVTLGAGYDPTLGSKFFERLPDPGNRILGSHPARAARIAQVRRAIEDVRSGRAN